MTKYELVIVLPGSLEKESQEKLSKKLKETVSSVGGSVLGEIDWGTKHLAYPVKHEQSGRYFIWTVEITKTAIKELRRLLNFEMGLLRYLLLTVDQK